jgi:hypothetical protein
LDVAAVLVTFTIAGDISSFNATAQLAFRTRLASQFSSVTADQISLNVTAASLSVAASIVVQSTAAASAAANTLNTMSLTNLTSALGVTVQSVTSATVIILTFPAPSPPPPSPPPLPPPSRVQET